MSQSAISEENNIWEGNIMALIRTEMAMLLKIYVPYIHTVTHISFCLGVTSSSPTPSSTLDRGKEGDDNSPFPLPRVEGKEGVTHEEKIMCVCVYCTIQSPTEEPYIYNTPISE